MSTKRDDRQIATMTPRTPDEWRQFAEHAQREAHERAEREQLEREELEAPQREMDARREEGLRRIGITIDRDGVWRRANGQPVIGSNARGGVWTRPRY